MKKILITGGAGYIGSMLSTELVMQGYEVTVIDKLEYKKNSLDHLFFFKNFKFIKEDVTNKIFIKKIIKKFDIVIPLAALVGAPLCDKKPKEAELVNFECIKDIVHSLGNSQSIFYMNSNSGYGYGEKNSYCDETSELRPISLYGRTKVLAEKEVVKAKNFAVLRLATVFGFSYRMRTDLLVNYYTKEAYFKKKIDIYEPNFRRNFVHVRDVVYAIIFFIKNFSKVKNDVYNFGLSNANISKIQLARKIKEIIPGVKINIIKGNDQDQRDYFVSNKKIEKKYCKAKISLLSGIMELKKIYEKGLEEQINNY
jgi:nucleoside-diphosphate-sugar epimerase